MTHEPCGECVKCLKRENEALKTNLSEIDRYIEYRNSLYAPNPGDPVTGIMKIREEQKK